MQRRRLIQGLLAAPLLSNFSLDAAHGETGHKVYAIRPPSEKFLTMLPQLMEYTQVPGFGAAVIQPGRPAWKHYTGLANAESKTAIGANSLFPAASLGKPVFTHGVLQLASDGLLDLDRPLDAYLQDETFSGELAKKVTARHVLSHTTGFVNWRGGPNEKLVSRFEPGTKFGYSGEGFFNLQRCVEKITNQGIESWMQEHVFATLSMSSSTYLWRSDAPGRLVQGYRGGRQMNFSDFPPILFQQIQASGTPLASWNTAKITDVMMKRMSNPRPLMPEEIVPNVASSLLTTIDDYAAFLSAAVEPPVHASPALLDLDRLSRRPAIKINSALGWGLGLGTEDLGGELFQWQWGDNGAWKNFVLLHPKSRSALVVFTNGAGGMHLAERFVLETTSVEHPAFLWL